MYTPEFGIKFRYELQKLLILVIRRPTLSVEAISKQGFHDNRCENISAKGGKNYQSQT